MEVCRTTLFLAETPAGARTWLLATDDMLLPQPEQLKVGGAKISGCETRNNNRKALARRSLRRAHLPLIPFSLLGHYAGRQTLEGPPKRAAPGWVWDGLPTRPLPRREVRGGIT